MQRGLWRTRLKRVIFAANWPLEQANGYAALDDLFKGRHFGREVIILCVRWHLRFKLSFRDLVGNDG
ncbi:hypothetical protein [Methylocapsa acidiphila]|uniref:hypothetical protein n=1 Tax=Methylocapsa acidiphila TaxID=133552 RepID=UPI0018DB7E79|nr:hypothetical protein [Methylocapsa acidiphila]